MIRINLLGEKPDYTILYLLQGFVYLVSNLLVVSSCFFMQETTQDDIERLKADKLSLEAQLAKIKDKTERVDALEKKRNLLRAKLTTIARLKLNKTGPVHMLAELTEAIPEKAWIYELSQTLANDAVEVKGYALDAPTISNFMRKLESLPSFGEVDLIVSKQIIKESVPIQEFSISAKLENRLTAQQQMKQTENISNAAKNSNT